MTISILELRIGRSPHHGDRTPSMLHAALHLFLCRNPSHGCASSSGTRFRPQQIEFCISEEWPAQVKKLNITST